MRLRLLAICAALLSAIPACAQITGYVYGSDSKPLANVVVRAHRPETVSELRERIVAGAARPMLATATTDEQGAFKLDAKTSGVIVIAVAAAGHRPLEQRELANEKDVVMMLAAAKPVRGRVTANGKPLAGATIVAAGEVPFATTTDARGDYTLPALDDSVWALSVFHPEAGAATQWKERALSPDFDLRTAPLTGRVVDANGKPAAGAKLFADGWPIGKSGDDGAFSIPLIAGQQQLQAFSGDLQGMAVRNSNDLVIALAPQRVIRVTVRDALETPFAGAIVRASSDYGEAMGEYTRRVASAITDEKGRARLIAAPGYAWVSAVGAKGTEFEAAEVPTSDGDAEITLTATAVTYVRGVLRDEEQRPVASARVFPAYGAQTILYSPTNAQKHTISAADGTFRVQLPAGSAGPMRVLALHPHYAIGESADIDSASAKESVVIVMPKGIAVHGNVVTADGKAVEGASVIPVEQANVVRPDGAAGLWLARFEPWLRTDAAGRFTLHLRPQPHELVFGGKHYQPLLVSDVEPRRGMEPLRVVLEPGVEIRGRVVSKRPLGEYETRVIAASADYEGYFYATPDAEGRFTFTALRPGTYKVGIGTVMKVVRAPATDVVLELAAKVDVRGRVVDKGSGAPLTRFNVTATPLSTDIGGNDGEQFEHGEGKFTLPVLPGRVRIEATAEGYLTSPPEFFTIDVEKPPEELRLALQRGRTIRGRVTSSDGDPVEASIILLDDDGVSQASAHAGEGGRYEANGVPLTAMSLVATAEEFVIAHKPIPAGNAELRVDVELSSGLKLAGRVVKEDGSAAAGVNVEASTIAHDGGSQYAETDADGRFSMQGLVEALYEVNASSSDGSATIAKVDPRNTAPLVLTLRKSATGRVRGTVSGLSGPPRGDVTGTSIDQRTSTGRIDRDGNYVMTDVPAGQNTLRATARAGKSQIVSRAVTVEVVAGSEVTADLVFEEGIDVRGTVTRNGQPAVAADVLFQLERDSPGLWRTTTGDDGSYEVRGLERGMYQIAAVFHNDNTSKRQIIDSPATIDFQLDAARIEGRVVDDDRNPLASVRIDITRLDDDSTASASTDAAGIFSAPAIGGARYRLFPSKSGYTAQSVDTQAGGEAVTLTMTRADALKVRVVDGRDGSTLDGWAEAQDDAGRIVARSGQVAVDGTVRLPVSGGTFRISASAPGFASQSTRVNVPSSAEVRIALTPGGIVQIDAPADSTALVRFLLPAGDAYIHCLCDGQHELRLNGATTRISNMAGGTYTLQLIDANGRASRGYPVVVREGEVTRVRVE
jgi:protocatechuate 3,4-dioxygenase beta subunit